MQTENHNVEALVSPDLEEADILLNLQDMRKQLWGLLSEDSPKTLKKPAEEWEEEMKGKKMRKTGT